MSEYYWHGRKNIRILPDGKLFTHGMPYINTVWYYWRKICAYGQFILSITFLTLIYLTYQWEEFWRIADISDPVQILQQTNHENNRYVIFSNILFNNNMIKNPAIYVSTTESQVQLINIRWCRENIQHYMLDRTYYNKTSIDNYRRELFQTFTLE